MKYDKMLMLLTLVAAGLAAGCSDDEDPLKDWTGPSKPGTEIKTPAEVGNRVVAHRGGSTEAGTRQFPDNSVAALNYAIGLGCYASECDIYLTKDDDVVVAHASAGCYINNLKPWEHTLAELRAVRFKIIKPNAELFIVNAKMCFPLVYGSVRQYRAKAQPRTVVHRKQLQNFIRDCVVHETGSHIFLPFFRNFRERHLKISAGGNILFGNGANHGKAFFCFNSSYPTVRRIQLAVH